jgi:parvulin-like peptidyl-prolyl isomerase
MFAFGDLETAYRLELEALAQKPLAELLLQQGVLRTIAQDLLLKQLRQSVTFTPEEEPVILTRLWEGVGTEPPATLAGDWISQLPEGLQVPMAQRWDQVRLQKLMEERYRDGLEPYFLERRKDLEQVVYGMIRLKNQGAAEELYLRLIDDHADFYELAKTYSLGEERFTHGLVGPMLISQPHPTIRAVLESLKVGEVHAPFRVDQWILLVRMEHRQPASLNDATRIQLLQELLQKELDESLDALLASVYPTLLPTAEPLATLEPQESAVEAQPELLPQAL